MRAHADARRIASFLREQGANRIVGFGSAFTSGKRFSTRSDVDLAVEGLPAGRFFDALARAQALTDFKLDVVPLETANAFLRRIVRDEGVSL